MISTLSRQQPNGHAPPDVPSASPAAPGSPASRRSDAIDFWRGFVLCTIFVNHVPGNVFERLTFRNFGLSDSAEAFVFIAGLSLALAYGPRFAGERRPGAARRLLRRALHLYGLHVALSLAGLAILLTGALASRDWSLMSLHGRDLVFERPLAALAGLLTLGHQFGYFNILPLYVVLMGCAPLMLWIGVRSRLVLLAGSGALYGATRLLGLNLPTWPIGGGWFFDPLAWQVLTAIGIAIGLERKTRPIGADPLTIGVALSVVLASCLAVNDGFRLLPGAWEWVRAWADLDKTYLGLGRLIHFLALAYLVHVSRLAGWLAATPLHAPLCMIGRHGLAMFALLSLVSTVDQVIANAYDHSLGLDIGMIGVGLAILYTAARTLEARRSRPRSPGAHRPIPKAIAQAGCGSVIIEATTRTS